MRKALIPVLALALLLSAWTLAPRPSLAESTMPVMTGETWQQLAQDDKLLFIWGFLHFAEYERGLLAIAPEDDDWSYIPAIVQGLQGKTFNDVMYEVDAFYTTNPDKLGQPVVETIIRAVVIPAL